MLTVILSITAVICYLVLWVTYKSQATYNKGMLFAVTLPAHVTEHEDIKQIQADYKKRFAQVRLWMGVSFIPILALHVWTIYQIVYFFIWFTVFFFIMVSPFRRAFRDTLALKREQEWFVGAKRVLMGDLRATRLKNGRAAPLGLFAIPFVMAIGLLLWSGNAAHELFLLGLSALLLTALLFLTSLYMRRTKAKVYSMNSDTNILLNQARRRATSYLLLVVAIMANVHFSLIYLLIMNENPAMEGLWIAIILSLSLIPVGWIIYVYRSISAQEQDVLAHDGKVVYTDDDEYWANGMTYHNPHDPSVFVTKRIGIGETINTATAAGKAIVWSVIGVVAVLILGTSFMMIRSELSSPLLTITADKAVNIDYPMYSFQFLLTDIEEAVLVEEIPSGSKRNGESTSTYARGHFRLKEVGKSRLYIYKKNPPYIRLKLKDSYVYYNDKEAARTRELFGQLEQQLVK